MSADAGWLASLKVGDRVAVEASGSSEVRIGRVIRRTPTGRTVVRCGEHEETFDKHGRHRFDSWRWTDIAPFTPEVEERICRARIVSRLSAMPWRTVETRILRAVEAALATPKAEATDPGVPAPAASATPTPSSVPSPTLESKP